jgi:hypothetical protein
LKEVVKRPNLDLIVAKGGPEVSRGFAHARSIDARFNVLKGVFSLIRAEVPRERESVKRSQVSPHPAKRGKTLCGPLSNRHHLCNGHGRIQKTHPSPHHLAALIEIFGMRVLEFIVSNRSSLAYHSSNGSQAVQPPPQIGSGP